MNLHIGHARSTVHISSHVFQEQMTTPQATAAHRRATNVSISTGLLAQARELEVNPDNPLAKTPDIPPLQKGGEGGFLQRLDTHHR
jgi:hypothetical protein